MLLQGKSVGFEPRSLFNSCDIGRIVVLEAAPDLAAASWANLLSRIGVV